MRLNNFKYLLSLIVILGLFLVSCSDTDNPIEGTQDNTDNIKKVEFAPSVEQAKTQTESVLEGIVKSVASYQVGSEILGDKLAKTSSVNYVYLNDWHTWRGDIDMAFQGFENVYQLDYLSKVQFQDAGLTSQVSPTGAQYMLMYLNSHGRFGFVEGDPRGDEVWFKYEGMASPLHGNPSMANLFGNYERRWVGEYSEDGENWELTELHYNIEFAINGLEFFYDWVNDDFYLNGNATFYLNGFRLLVRFTNSRVALVEVYGGALTDTLVETYQLELPNFYQMINVPSLEDWNKNLTFIFPVPIVL